MSKDQKNELTGKSFTFALQLHKRKIWLEQKILVWKPDMKTDCKDNKKIVVCQSYPSLQNTA